jgi:hypothetical protein
MTALDTERSAAPAGQNRRRTIASTHTGATGVSSGSESLLRLPGRSLAAALPIPGVNLTTRSPGAAHFDTQRAESNQPAGRRTASSFQPNLGKLAFESKLRTRSRLIPNLRSLTAKTGNSSQTCIGAFRFTTTTTGKYYLKRLDPKAVYSFEQGGNICCNSPISHRDTGIRVHYRLLVRPQIPHVGRYPSRTRITSTWCAGSKETTITHPTRGFAGFRSVFQGSPQCRCFRAQN